MYATIYYDGIQSRTGCHAPFTQIVAHTYEQIRVACRQAIQAGLKQTALKHIVQERYNMETYEIEYESQWYISFEKEAQ